MLTRTSLLFALLASLAFGQSTWTVKYNPTFLDVLEAHVANCSVYIQHDGAIRLNIFDPFFDPKIPGFSGGVYENITLVPSGQGMTIKAEMWAPAHIDSNVDAITVSNYRGPDLFWQECSAKIPALPSNVLKAFRGYRGLPTARK